MGQFHQFVCEGCGYVAEVSGGIDVGMSSATQTIACADCKDLFDVPVSAAPWDPKAPRQPLRCPKAGEAEHDVQPWAAEGPCPRCGEQMDDEGGTVLWD